MYSNHKMNIVAATTTITLLLKQVDDTERPIGYSHFNDVVLIGKNHYYPNVLLYSADKVISPYDEKIMSLNRTSFYENNRYDMPITINGEEEILTIPIFFFIYNFDNYYHFLYDTLPYLYTYLELKKTIPLLKLLICTPHFYKFNRELLEKIVNIDTDLLIHCENRLYKSVYVSTSLTHGGHSNNPPRKEIYEIYEILKSKVNMSLIREEYKNMKRIYVSRRATDTSNIGTNYTTRRKMMNEDALVTLLETHNFKEILTENLNTDEKIYLFQNADMVVGSIGGGVANLLFSPRTTKSLIIVSPFFLDINYRFKYSMEHTDIIYSYDVSAYTDIPLYCRVKIIASGKYGEISAYDKDYDKYCIQLSNDVAGFNNAVQFDKEWFRYNEFELLDNGLNSPYILDINKIEKYI